MSVQYSVPSWMLEQMPKEIAEQMLKLAAQKQLGAIAPKLAEVDSAVKTFQSNRSDSTAIVNGAKVLISELQNLVSEIEGKSETQSKSSSSPLTPAQLKSKEDYERCYYWVMSHLPSDLNGKKYREIKTDSRVVTLWNRAKVLDSAGKLTRSGKEK